MTRAPSPSMVCLQPHAHCLTLPEIPAMKNQCFVSLLLLGFAASISSGDGPADNTANNVRRVPKLGIEVPADIGNELSTGLAELEQAIAPLRTNPRAAPLLPDVLVYHKAVHDALKYHEFFDDKE